MTKPNDIPPDVWDAADAVRAAVFNAMHDDDGRLTDNDPSEIIARAILDDRERAKALLKSADAVYANHLRGEINGSSIVAAERERCARFHDDMAAQHDAEFPSDGGELDWHVRMAASHRRYATAIRKGGTA